MRHLGGGERYEVFLAWDDQLLSLAVAKVLRPSLADDPASRAALEAEAAVLQHLSHVVDVYVGYLRKKLGSGLITSVRGMGYRLEPSSSSEPGDSPPS